jgi:hypothetical protein
MSSYLISLSLYATVWRQNNGSTGVGKEESTNNNMDLLSMSSTVLQTYLINDLSSDHDRLSTRWPHSLAEAD